MLYLYLAVTPTTVSLALIQEENQVQRLIYYTNQALYGVEQRYPKLKKVTFALVTSKRKLRSYF